MTWRAQNFVVNVVNDVCRVNFKNDLTGPACLYLTYFTSEPLTQASRSPKPSFRLCRPIHHHLMASKAQQEGRILLAMQAYQKGQITSILQAALTYNVPRKTLSSRINGRVARVDIRANSHKLTPTEEQALIQWVISMDNRGYAPRVSAVRDAARLLL